jgi:spoIIIJ-associated protein
MPLEDKVAAAKRIDQLLRDVLSAGGFLLKYRIVVDPPVQDDRDWERPQILVTFSGPDAPLLLERGAELLRSLEHVSQKVLRLESEDHDKVVFDSMNHRAMRMEELRQAADVAAEKVLKTGVPYQFGPMTARERRIVHLALRDHPGLKTESHGEGPQRCVTVLPKNAKAHKEGG